MLGEYYVDWDEETLTHCVFHTEKGDFAFASYCDESEAKEYANKLRC